LFYFVFLPLVALAFLFDGAMLAGKIPWLYVPQSRIVFVRAPYLPVEPTIDVDLELPVVIAVPNPPPAGPPLGGD